MRRIVFAFALIWLFTIQAFPCTTFILEGGKRVYLAKNLDWDWDEGFVLINPKGLQKRALVLSTNAAMWTSKQGSVTFNQFGRELPFGGMNEAGLVVESMWLGKTQYPPADARPEINMLQWIQYQLDNYSSVKEVIESDKKIRLENTDTRARIHYLVCDAQGNSATIEFLNGSMTVHSGKTLGYRALANDTYESSAAALKTDPARGDLSKPLPSKDSMSRFCRAAARAKAFQPGKELAQDVEYAFETLDQIRQGTYTVWQSVYDSSARSIYFRTSRNMKERHIELKSLDFTCRPLVQFADIHADGSPSGNVEFGPLSEEKHHQFLTRFYAQQSLKREVGDLSWMVEPVLMILRAYKCVDQ
jgi:penicillin V acylase-like amidase (Ntn superfamily)